ncbi:PREDICTED: dihydroxyacetone phosphate acyltransferase [Wasmannia auropunctata]|uniref:dihydroxyacetone phosphate acyltransferase n=1 Tax=Wasmannia auropunctata TaxID=64793 RepID=UPI0005EF4703|nr:PREDICTED: dihydroxyacetone phosphate acyltransferase [Wasmannia auropunctata]XP_011692354.1 PREDICTED: dihydroxyacetone phosphate acyltransferase [Wasmannia auropunctata]XP_011692355.1 PREDICTED: dihydroxyacetone phosphate acyltransferase [Wasmannia auropunctata]XP_011692356.1 PREDICTED: dihydroxyacetone phosphate acyltransferase [Wasmannia auropunctata]XP_011692357.1 PREDICTED: dihydroxyacetone phosphate acyltransferase [Wasmannia auropunctata]XP_011692358.1 PREDICTED: dihydroxyacetone ph
MEHNPGFVDLLENRRRDCDFLWATRPMDPSLPHMLPPESVYDRERVMQAVLHDKQVKAAIDTVARTTGASVKDVEGSARAMINEMASKADLATVRWLGIFITKAMKRMFSKIYINETMLSNLKRETRISQVQYIYVPSHRSYLDFVLLSYILFSYDMALPNIAAGMDFYNMKIVGELLRKTGAFYIRRSFSNDVLYKQIFRSYISTIVSHSDRAIEFFIEGTRSRSQKTTMPKYGLLSIIVESLLQGDVPDIHFVPMSINYERPPEELLFVYEMLGVPKPKESTTGLFRSLSILQKPFSHGRIFFNIGEPISTSRFVDRSYRQRKILQPSYKIPSSVVENIAYLIIEAHKRNTVLIPINIIALLVNERIQTNPKEPYTLDSLAQDYRWFKSFVTKSLKAFMHETEITANDTVKQEILESLKPHDELIVVDSSNTLKIKQRHKGVKQINYSNIKGHPLSERTLQVAVPAINIAIYINPTLIFLAQTAFITATIAESGTQIEAALERYALLRRLLSTEFVMRPIEDEALIRTEWEKSLNVLLSQNCLYTANDSIFIGNNTKLFSILHNVVLPFIDVIYVICILLSEWTERTSVELTDRTILVETQKEVERLMFETKDRCQHPYCLSLDLYSTTWSSLLSQDVVAHQKHSNTYRTDRAKLAYLIGALRELPLRHPTEIYVNAFPSIISTPLIDVQAKL